MNSSLRKVNFSNGRGASYSSAKILKSTNMGKDTHQQKINILLTSFAGLGFPRTLSLPTSASTTVKDALELIASRLPATNQPLTITTTSSRPVIAASSSPLSSLVPSGDASILPLRLSVAVRGGKGGFGSQLRAAGGRMSSRKKNRDNNINPNGSNRNLDGRRLRTVDEAKRLAEYLAIKPEMEKREKEQRRKRWEAVVEASEKREEEIKRGGVGGGRLDSEWVEAKEGAEERVRESVMKAMRELQAADEMEDVERKGSESGTEGEEGESGDEAGEGSSGSSEDVKVLKVEGGRKLFGWDEEDDDDDSEDEDENENEPSGAAVAVPAYEGKGKNKAT